MRVHVMSAFCVELMTVSISYHAKNQIDSFIHSEIGVPCPFLTTTTQKLLKNVILNFPEFA